LHRLIESGGFSGTWNQELPEKDGANDIMNEKEIDQGDATVNPDYDLVRAFEATVPISARKRPLEPGDVIASSTGQVGATVSIEVDVPLFLVDRTMFRICCKFRNSGGAGA